MLIKRMPLRDVKCRIFLLRLLSPSSHPVFFSLLSRAAAKMKKVGREVSLNIDLQDISELDRDAVIAQRSREKKSKDALREHR